MECRWLAIQAPAANNATSGTATEVVFMAVNNAVVVETTPVPAAPAAMAFEASRETAGTAACASAVKPASMVAASDPPALQPRRRSLARRRSVARSMRFCAASVPMPRVSATSRTLSAR